ncbi:hypothetical protein LSH36_523g01059 [Paralvinella palmiformis]|uniref:Myosin N-terminal SH3-like domain-containing protein n=1 Tax=Paralvinella palmiformis TaxID=53620 RepID=A0AAD9J7X5_9ANNE|nr:hypothetical protein LSH36_523g01059 [Paralvinella palmiformis]
MALEDDPDFQYLMISKKKLLEEQNQPFDGKKNCWIADAKEGYLKAEIKSTKGDEERTVKKDVIQQMNPPKFEKITDMANLTYLNEASVLYNLKARYQASLIYVSRPYCYIYIYIYVYIYNAVELFFL